MAGIIPARRPSALSQLGTLLSRGTQGLDAQRAAQIAAEEARQQTVYQDRLRAMLSPADTAQGSGLGAAPSLESQEAAIADARLVNPAAAEMFSPVVAGQRRAQQAASLFGNDLLAQTLYGAGNEEFLKALGQQYAPQVVAPGSAQVVGGRRTIEQPTFGETGDTTVRRTSEGVTPVFTRTTPSISEGIAQQNANTTQAVGMGGLDVARGRLDLDVAGAGTTLSPGQTRYGLDGQPIVSNAPPQANRDAQNATALQAINNTRGAIDRARGQTGFWTTGPLAALPFNTPSRDLNSTLDTIKANLSFNELQQMRANSPTGGALGSIAVRELDLLGSTVASLDQAQSKEELERSLGIIEQSLNRWEQTVQQAQSQPQAQGGSVSVSSPAQAQALAPGTRYRTPDGQEYIR